MLMHLKKNILKASCCTAVLGLMAAEAPLSFAQTKGDIVRIGDSVKDQAYYQSYWQNLRIKAPSTPSNSSNPSSTAPTSVQPTNGLLNSQALKKLIVQDLQLARSGIPNYRFRQSIVTPGFSNIYQHPLEVFPIENHHPFVHFSHERYRSPATAAGLISGTLTNLNTFPVTVLGVNFKIVDAFGDLVQTGTVSPEPSMIGPRQSVTFQKPLYSLPLYKRYEVKLLDPAFVMGD
jgi:hypothetical protein